MLQQFKIKDILPIFKEFPPFVSPEWPGLEIPHLFVFHKDI